MTNSYDVDHGLSQDAPGPLEPVEFAQQDDTLARTGNTARDQEMYAAGIRTGEENTKHNAAIRGCAAPAAPVSTVEDVDAQKEAVMEAIAGALGDAYDCLRVWSAWSYGTMGPDDFSLVAEDGDRVAEIADAAIAAMRPAPAAGDALDAARWRAYAKLFPEISASFLATHGVDGGDPLPTIKGASITGGYVVVTPAGWDADKATKLRDAILRMFPVNPAHTPRPSDELAAQRKGDA